MLLVDRFPRPKYMAVGMLGCVATFAGEAGLVAQYAGSDNDDALRAGIARWKFYLCLIIPSFFLALIMWFFYPDTRGKPLEEIAAIFGDDDEVAVRQADVEIDTATHEIHAKGARTGLTIDASDIHYAGEK
ncbi:uncharacterized protein Z518_07423 [Rhinocladiella mackenziei CBS 650.93]|uniref:Major facilitator superfamily (MFS) profile domain-containing protein n=1 Tax=Rhinocladiella mackenziei CBS 650.93 TaxID=1442369 RepID=A0A0D2J4C6_9EURO|nr:uncharacterized protein Z518_07423 [Rhinocladiella mackenziei CBS 650.93]KIX03870.1 hypothetical protein Z518_07423 [Rhinocladiella mackenziei CBS 650.93]